MLELDFTQTLGSHRLNINETLPADYTTAVFGVSSVGKTALINAIDGLTRPEKGRVVLNGRVLSDTEQNIFLLPEKQRIGYVFQDVRLFPHYGVGGNLRYGMAKSMLPQFDKLVALLGTAGTSTGQFVRRRETAGGYWPGAIDRPRAIIA